MIDGPREGRWGTATYGRPYCWSDHRRAPRWKGRSCHSLGVVGNQRADRLPEKGHEMHPNNTRPLPKQPRMGELEALGQQKLDSLDVMV